MTEPENPGSVAAVRSRRRARELALRSLYRSEIVHAVERFGIVAGGTIDHHARHRVLTAATLTPV